MNRETQSNSQKPSLKEKFQYWLDNRMSHGSLALIRILLIITLIAIALIASLIILFRLNEDAGPEATIWDSFATVINSWMPYAEDGNIAYRILMALGAIIGLLFTSLLIGIFSSAIEEKMQSLKRGNSKVLESDHFIIVGYQPGEFTLIQQLILAAEDKPCCLVIAADLEKDEMETGIQENINIPGNITLVCRTVNIFDPASYEKCSVSKCRSVIINPMSDLDTAKVLLAVTKSLRAYPNSKATISALVSSRKYHFPESVTARHNVSVFHTYEMLAKILAHSCTQAGLSKTFEEIFNFEGSELYSVSIPGSVGMSFKDLSLCLDQGVPVGLYRENRVFLNPNANQKIEPDDHIIVFSETKDSAHIVSQKPVLHPADHFTDLTHTKLEHDIVILGYSPVLSTILKELPEDIFNVQLANLNENQAKTVIEALKEIRPQMRISFVNTDVYQDGALLDLVREMEHVVVLNERMENIDESDMRCIIMILRLTELREKHHLNYNISAELISERNLNLVAPGNDSIDYIVASNMMSLFLAQLAHSPELSDALREILSNEGNEIYLKPAADFGCVGQISVADLRNVTLTYHYVFLGLNKRDGYKNQNFFNPGLNEIMDIQNGDMLILLGEN